MPSEPVAATDIVLELSTNWDTNNVVKPQLIELTGAADAIRVDLNRGDYLIVKTGSPTLEETPLGNWKYVNRVYNVVVDMQTRLSRQRLYDLMREIRRICHVRRHNMTNFQRLQFQNFDETVGEATNVWLGTVQLQTVNENILAETS